MEHQTDCQEHPQLRAVPLFAGLPANALAELAQNTRQRTYAKGAVVVNEGDPAHSFFIVCSGSLKACLNDDQGREVILSVLGPGDHFGELALLDDSPRSASVAALEPSELLLVTKRAFQVVLEKHPDCMYAIVKELAGRVRELTENVRTLALVDVFGRIARLLTSLAAEDGGVQAIRPRLTQQDIANRVGSSREMVSRILKDLVIGGYLSIEADRIVLHRKLPNRW
jgi:CRP/FNR family cyclic AMP-dependent transcriptional regulator